MKGRWHTPSHIQYEMLSDRAARRGCTKLLEVGTTVAAGEKNIRAFVQHINVHADGSEPALWLTEPSTQHNTVLYTSTHTAVA